MTPKLLFFDRKSKKKENDDKSFLKLENSVKEDLPVMPKERVLPNQFKEEVDKE